MKIGDIPTPRMPDLKQMASAISANDPRFTIPQIRTVLDDILEVQLLDRREAREEREEAREARLQAARRERWMLRLNIGTFIAAAAAVVLSVLALVH